MAVKNSERPLVELSALQRDVLAQLAGMDAPKGVTVVATLEDSYDDTVTETSVYNALTALGNMGLVESKRGGREKYYQTTDAGERELRADIKWRQQ